MIYCDDCGAITDKNYGPEDGTIRCARCSGATEDAAATGELSLLDDPMNPVVSENNGTSKFRSSDETIEDLDLFSSETIAQKRRKPTPSDETSLHLVEDDGFGRDDETAADPSVPTESEVEAALNFDAEEETFDVEEETESWQFDCLACSVRLSVVAVAEKSKLICPRCDTWMVIDVDGEVIIPEADFGAPESSRSVEELEQLREEIHSLADGIGFPETTDEFAVEDFDTDDFSGQPVFQEESAATENSWSSPSAAALEAAEVQASGGEVITKVDFMTEDGEGTFEDEESTPASITTPADDYSAAISDLEAGEELSLIHI